MAKKTSNATAAKASQNATTTPAPKANTTTKASEKDEDKGEEATTTGRAKVAAEAGEQQIKAAQDAAEAGCKSAGGSVLDVRDARKAAVKDAKEKSNATAA